MRVGSGEVFWEGPELAGPDSRRLLRVYGAVVGESGAADALAAGKVKSAMYLLAGHARGVSMLLDVLKGWEHDGETVTRDLIDNTEDPMEPWAVLLEVLMTSGFFGPVHKAQMVLMNEAIDKIRAAQKAKETPTSE